MGGTDEPSNIMECSVEEHAELHFALYLAHGHWQDWYAAMGLAGIIGKEEIVREQQSRAGIKGNTGRKRPDFVEYLKGEGRNHHGGGRNKGVARTEEVKKLMSERRKGIKTRPEDNKKRSEAMKEYWRQRKLNTLDK